MDCSNNTTAYLKKKLPRLRQKRPTVSNARLEITKLWQKKEKSEPQSPKEIPKEAFVTFNDIVFKNASESAGEMLGRIKSIVPENLK